MAVCALALLLTTVLCLGGRQPGVVDDTDRARNHQKSSNAQPLEQSLFRQMTVNTQSTHPKTTLPSTRAHLLREDGDKQITTQAMPDPLVSEQGLMLSKSSSGRHLTEVAPESISVKLSGNKGPQILHSVQKRSPVNHGKPTTMTRIENDYGVLKNEESSSSDFTQDKGKYYWRDNPNTGAKKKDLSFSVGLVLQTMQCGPCKCTHDKSKGLVADCRAKGLKEIPTSLPANMAELLLARNQLHTLTDGAFSGSPNLRLLDLSINVITNFSKVAFKGLPNLQFLYLHGNKLCYTPDIFTAEILAPLRSLRHLTLHNNTDDMAEDLDYPHLALSRLPLLEELSLDGLTNKTFGEGFANLTNLKTLTLSGMQGFCKVQTVSNQTFLTLAPLRNLFIVKCDLREMEKGTFLPLQNIDTLDISKNTNLGIDEAMGATYGLQASSIRVFYANEIVHYFTPCLIVTVENLQYFANTHIEELHMEQLYVEAIQKNALLAFQYNLKRLYVRGSPFMFGSYWFDLVRLQNLELLHVGMYDEIPPLPALSQVLYKYSNDEANEKGTHGHQAEKHIFQVKNTRKRKSRIHLTEDDSSAMFFKLPPNLTEVSLRGCLLRTVISDITFSPHNALHILDLSVNLFTTWTGPIRNLHQLKVLNLSQNNADHINFTVFSDFPNLQTFDISHNILSEMLADERNIQLYSDLRSLRHFNVSFNGLFSIPEGLFRELPHLVTLRLAGNKFIAEVFTVDLSLMSNLTVLDLSSNSFQGLSPKTRLTIDKLTAARNASLTLDLRNNPLACTCGNLDFLRWLHKAHVQLVQAEEQQCIYENASHVPLWAGLEELEASCGERGLLFAGSALAFVLLCAVIVGLVLYRYRWKLRYLYYIHRGRYMQEQVAREDFRYDVFLSYDTDDYQWVTRQMLPHLEAQGLRVCFHQRDFLPGRPIAANIVEAVQTSRRTVCVLSTNFLDSQWCLYEMQMAILEGVHSHRDVLLLLVYEHVGPQALPREVLHYYQTDSYLEYPRDARCLPFFWENLTLALRH